MSLGAFLQNGESPPRSSKRPVPCDGPASAASVAVVLVGASSGWSVPDTCGVGVAVDSGSAVVGGGPVRPGVGVVVGLGVVSVGVVGDGESPGAGVAPVCGLGVCAPAPGAPTS